MFHELAELVIERYQLLLLRQTLLEELVELCDLFLVRSLYSLDICQVDHHFIVGLLDLKAMFLEFLSLLIVLLLFSFPFSLYSSIR